MTLVSERAVRVVCPHDCPDTCSMVVSVRDGRAVRLRGDREHPFTRGFLCQKVTRYLERVYHPDRLRHPMRRVSAGSKLLPDRRSVLLRQSGSLQYSSTMSAARRTHTKSFSLH